MELSNLETLPLRPHQPYVLTLEQMLSLRWATAAGQELSREQALAWLQCREESPGPSDPALPQGADRQQ